MKRSQASSFRRGQTGIALLEVLVSVLLFSLGLLGLIGLQARAISFSSDAEDRNRAALLANEAVALMWLNKSVNVPAGELSSWQSRVADPLAGGLPSGDGQVNVSGTAATVVIKWRAPTHDADSQLTTRVVLP
ncbi:fimbrial assembly protein [Variovorax beijingensis]|uniref:Fimbrial assembly protein n=1 Tax=Variovorax beijingensis TaxID=2496117 RepID=A0ABY0A7C7_9BURK|nr:fimbrial assembly protein [Variovorax beijingensis]RSZ37537.1 fimbrial assembly protein [Variovorax beijingensis]